MNDSGSIVLGWLTKLALVLGLLGLLSFDGIALVTANFTASDHATTAASAAADMWKGTHDIQKTYNAAVQAVTDEGDTIDTGSFQVDPEGHVTLVLHRTARTLWLQRVGPLAHFTRITATGEGSPPS